MKTRLGLILFCALIAGGPAAATPGGLMSTVGLGLWTCELPGDATTPPMQQPEGNFRIVPDSSYIASSGGRGAYLLLGSTFTMTSGPFAGRHFVKAGGATLVRLGPNGERLPLRCVRSGVVRDDEKIITPGITPEPL